MSRHYSQRADERWVRRVVADIAKSLPRTRAEHIKRLRDDLDVAVHPALRRLIEQRLRELD